MFFSPLDSFSTKFVHSLDPLHLASFHREASSSSFLSCLQQEKATKWQDNVEMDGLTTNGVLIMHPKGKFCGGNAKCGLWRETSLGGDVFSLRESRSAQQKGQPVSGINFSLLSPSRPPFKSPFPTDLLSFDVSLTFTVHPLYRLRRSRMCYKTER